MTQDRTLVPVVQQHPLTRLTGTAAPALADGEVLRSPVSNTPCVHWRLRIVETMAPGMELVHEVSSPEPMQVVWTPPEGGPQRLLRVDLERARLEAQPTLHREGSPGARATARHFGLTGAVRVEEVLVRVGETLQAEGVLFDPEQSAGGPFRAPHGPAELMDATVKLETGLGLRPALLPWALGTAAAVLGGTGVTALVSKMCRVAVEAPAVGKAIKAELRAPLFPRPRWP
jgi:hypothetical protein